MTEANWLARTYPQSMLEFLRGKASDRKLRLFACAFCHVVDRFVTDERSRRAVAIAERFVDGLASREELDRASRDAEDAAYAGSCSARFGSGSWLDRYGAEVAAFAASSSCMASLLGTISQGRSALYIGVFPTCDASQLGALILHIIGNPFRLCETGHAWPSSVTQLADALYNGEDCAWALRDALLETGHAELAEHFRAAGQWHPKGCLRGGPAAGEAMMA